MATDRGFETGELGAAAKAMAARSLEGAVVRGIIESNRQALSHTVEHPVFAQGRAFVRQIEAGGTVQVKGVSRSASGFRDYRENR